MSIASSFRLIGCDNASKSSNYLQNAFLLCLVWFHNILSPPPSVVHLVRQCGRLLIIFALHKHWHLKTRWSRQKGVSKGYQEYQFILTLPPLVLRFWKGVGVIFNRGCPKDVHISVQYSFQDFLVGMLQQTFLILSERWTNYYACLISPALCRLCRVASFTPAP